MANIMMLTIHRGINLRPVVDYFVEKFKTVYIPEKTISIDEELLLWKGGHGFKQYIPNKCSRFEIKIFSLCEVSGYFYLGKKAIVSPEEAAVQKELGKSGAVVPKLMSDLYGTGIRVKNYFIISSSRNPCFVSLY